MSASTYDAARRLTNLRHEDGSGTVLANSTYGYDAADRLETEVLNGALQSYGYDATDQLTDDNGTGYTYDANGNRTNPGYQTDTGNRLVANRQRIVELFPTVSWSAMG